MKLRADILLALALVIPLAACSDSTEATAGPGETVETPSPEPAPFYVGVWAADPAWCTDQSVGFPITITETRFEGHENVCDMSDVVDTPEGGVTARLSCVSTGETIEEPIVFAPAGDQMAITYPDRDGEAILFSRCAGQ